MNQSYENMFRQQVHFHVNQTFSYKRFLRGLALKQRYNLEMVYCSSAEEIGSENPKYQPCSQCPLSTFFLSQKCLRNGVGTGADIDDVALYSVSNWLLLSSG